MRILPLLALAAFAATAEAQSPGAMFDRVVAVLTEEFFDRAFCEQQLPALAAKYRSAAVAAVGRDEERGVVHALLAEVPASHLALYSKATQRRLEAELVGKGLPTVGCGLLQNAGRFYVDTVLDHGPAARAGLRRGDEVVAIDGVNPGHSPLLDWRSDDAHLADPPTHDLLVDDDQAVELTLAGAPARAVTVTAARWSGYQASIAGVRELDVGGQRVLYVHLWFVYHALASRLLREALDEHEHCSGLLLDLRGRGGSALECTGVVAAVRAARARGVQVVALVDARTRSAKEVIAAELAQHRLATLVGERTAGAVVPATFAEVGDGAVLMYPASRLGSYSRRLEGIGVAPDRAVADPLPYQPGFDPVLAGGVEAMAELLRSPAPVPAPPARQQPAQQQPTRQQPARD